MAAFSERTSFSSLAADFIFQYETNQTILHSISYDPMLYDLSVDMNTIRENYGISLVIVAVVGRRIAERIATWLLLFYDFSEFPTKASIRFKNSARDDPTGLGWRILKLRQRSDIPESAISALQTLRRLGNKEAHENDPADRLKDIEKQEVVQAVLLAVKEVINLDKILRAKHRNPPEKLCTYGKKCNDLTYEHRNSFKHISKCSFNHTLKGCSKRDCKFAHVDLCSNHLCAESQATCLFDHFRKLSDPERQTIRKKIQNKA